MIYKNMKKMGKKLHYVLAVVKMDREELAERIEWVTKNDDWQDEFQFSENTKYENIFN